MRKQPTHNQANHDLEEINHLNINVPKVPWELIGCYNNNNFVRFEAEHSEGFYLIHENISYVILLLLNSIDIVFPCSINTQQSYRTTSVMRMTTIVIIGYLLTTLLVLAVPTQADCQIFNIDQVISIISFCFTILLPLQFATNAQPSTCNDTATGSSCYAACVPGYSGTSLTDFLFSCMSDDTWNGDLTCTSKLFWFTILVNVMMMTLVSAVMLSLI